MAAAVVGGVEAFPGESASVLLGGGGSGYDDTLALTEIRLD